jgi:dihydrofolate reductase
MGVSLDGFIAGPEGGFDWAAPDEELHRFHNEQAREVGGHLLGRRLWETMRVWQTIEEDRSQPDHILEFARIWKETPKVVFSTTLTETPRGVRLVREDAAGEVARMKAEPGGPLAVGGAGLAAALIGHGLVDEYGLFVNPVVVGSGTPFFPPLDEPLRLELVERRTFPAGVVLLRYRSG